MSSTYIAYRTHLGNVFFILPSLLAFPSTFPSPLLFLFSFPLFLPPFSSSSLSLLSSHPVDPGEHSSWSGTAKDWFCPHHFWCSVSSEKRWRGRWQLLLYVCVTCVYSSCAEGIEGLYSRELGIKYTEFEHIVVGHMGIMWGHVNIMQGHVIVM